MPNYDFLNTLSNIVFLLNIWEFHNLQPNYISQSSQVHPILVSTPPKGEVKGGGREGGGERRKGRRSR